MQRGKRMLWAAGLVALGYALGAAQVTGPQAVGRLSADDAAAGSGVSKEAEAKIRNVHVALVEAMDQLRQDGRYNAITDGINPFLVLSGGGDAQQDLDSGNGVDPETFAAIYAGKAIPELQEQLTTDDEGRILYQDKPITIYSRRRLQRELAERLRIKGTGL